MVTPVDLDASQRFLVAGRADEIITRGFDIPDGGGPDQVEATVALAVAARVLQDRRDGELGYDSYGVDTQSLQAQAASVLISRGVPDPRARWVAELGADLGVAHCRGAGRMKDFAFDGERVLQVLSEHLGAWEGLGASRKRSRRSGEASEAMRDLGVAALPEGAKVKRPSAVWRSDIGTRTVEEALTVIDVSQCDRDDVVGPTATPLVHFLAPYLQRGPVAIEGLKPPASGPFQVPYTVNFPDPRTIGPDFSIRNAIAPVSRSAGMSDQEMLRLGNCLGKVDVITVGRGLVT